MNLKAWIVLDLVLMCLMGLLIAPSDASAKKKSPDRAMLEKMEAVPCGANQKGLAGLGSFWASVGITDVHSNEKMCPQYLLRTDDMDYKVRPMNMKHPLVLPVGHEVIYKISKDRMFIRVPDGDDKNVKKMQAYEVVAAEPSAPAGENASRTNPQ